MTDFADIQVSLFDLDSQFGKMFPERSAQTTEKTSGQYSKKSQKSQMKQLQFLNLQKSGIKKLRDGDMFGIQSVASWEMVGQLPGESWMPNTGESPNAAVESSLSQILEANPHQKYYLSEKACAGILRRAEKRGKELPKILKEALQKQCLSDVDAEVGGKGPLIQDNKSATLSTNNIQTLFQPNPLMIEMTSTHNTVIDNGVCPTLTARMGTGGNQVNAVMTYQKTTGPLMANSHPGSYTGQDAYSDMLVAHPYPEKVANCLSKQPRMRYRLDMDNVVCSVDCRNMYENNNLSGTLQSKPNGGQSLNYQNPVRIGYSVRRLTPLECDRLQGYPDGWTDIPGASDSARYKADGNSVAIPCVEYVMSGIAEVIVRTMGLVR